MVHLVNRPCVSGHTFPAESSLLLARQHPAHQKNKMVKPYRCFQKQSHKKWPTVLASLMFITHLVAEIIQS